MVRTGVIGAGSMGKNHARVYSEMSDLVGVCDMDEEVARKTANRFGARSFTDHKDLLKTDVEAVTISAPTAYHHRVALDAINAGKHVLVEKPLASTLKEAGEVVEAAEAQGVVLAVGQIERHNPVVRFSKEALQEKRFGELITTSSRRVSSLPQRIKDVGVILDLGIHDIDVMRYLSGSPVESVYTLAGKKNGGDFETFAQIMLAFENHVSGVVEINWLTPMRVRKLWLTCSEDYVELDYMHQNIQVSSSSLISYDTSDLYNLPLEYDIRNIALIKQEPLKNELKDFLGAVENRTTPLVSGGDGMETLRVALAALESKRTGRKISMEKFEG